MYIFFRLSAVFIVLLVAPSAWAFEYDEHCQVSNYGLLIAASYAAEAGALSPEEHESVVQFATSSCQPGQSTSYGDLVSLVDYASSPIDFYLSIRNDSAMHYFSSDLIPVESITALDNTFSLASSSHLNGNHFQNRAMFSHWVWHKMATYVAANEKSISTALLLNAYSDHFLEDHFAPGHIRTPRRDFHDSGAVGMHDFYNSVGEVYIPSNTGELAAIGEGHLPLDLDELLSGMDLSLDQLLQQMSISGFRFIGDGDLGSSPEQLIFMSLVIARSTLDILESYSTGVPENSFEDYTWTGYTASSEGLSTPEAITRFGQFSSTNTRVPLTFMPIVIASVGPQSVFGSRSYASRVVARGEVLILGSPGSGWLEREDGSSVRFPQLGVPVGWDLLIGTSVAHGPTARVVFPLPKVDTQLGLTGGYRWHHDGDANDSGFHIGGQLEMGFGLAFLGLGIGRDLAFGPDGSLDPVVTLNTTLSVGWPVNRLIP